MMKVVGTAILDEFFDIRSANNVFLGFVGGLNYSSAIMLIKPEQQEKFRNMFNGLEQNKSVDGVFEMLNCDGNYYPVYVIAKYRDYDEKIYDVRVWDIIRSEVVFKDMGYQKTKLQNILTACGDVYFEYYPDTNEFKLFVYNGENETVIYNDMLDKWINNAFLSYYIDEENKLQFDRLCFDFAEGKAESEYLFKGSIFTDGERLQNIRFYCRNIQSEEYIRSVVGVVKVYSEDEQNKDSIMTSEASRDFLTGVLNKMAVKKYCDAKLISKPSYKMSMAVIDVDNFKHVNDNFGHMYGDTVLVKIAKIITDFVGENGIVGRIGGDEFFVFFENIKDFDELRGVLRSIRSSVEYEFKNKLGDVRVTLSIGVSKYPEDGEDYETLFKVADKAVYIAKDKGKNRYIIYNREIHGPVDGDEEDMVSVNGGSGREDIDYKDFLVGAVNNITLGANADYNTMFKELKEVFFVDRVKLYAGDKLELKYSSEDNDVIGESVDMLLDKEYISRFDENGQFVINKVQSLSFNFKEIYNYYNERNTYSAVQCIIGDKDNIKGIFVVERVVKPQVVLRGWSREEIKDFVLLARVMSSFM